MEPRVIRSSALWRPKWRTSSTTGTWTGILPPRTRRLLPAALPPPPGSLDGAFFLAFSLRRFLSSYCFYALIQIFLSFVVFHLRGGEGVLLGNGVNGAEDDGLITESKFVFLCD